MQNGPVFPKLTGNHMKSIVFLVAIISLCLSEFSFGQQTATPRQLLDNALTQIGSEDGWKAKSVGDDLKAIIDKYPSSPEFVTARALYVGYLMEQGENCYTNALSLADVVLSEKPQAWQAALVLLDKAVILGFQKKHQDAIAVAKDGLHLIDKAAIDKVNDPDFLRLLEVTHADRSGIKDGFLAVIATRLIRQGMPEKADEYLKQVTNQKARESVQRLREMKKVK